MDFQRELVRSFPNVQIAKILHGAFRRWRRG